MKKETFCDDCMESVEYDESEKYYTTCDECGNKIVILDRGARLTDREWVEFFLKLAEEDEIL